MARQLVIELVGEASKFTKSLDDASKASQSFGDKVKSAGAKMTAFATVPIVGFLGAATKAAAEDAAAQASLAKTLSNTAGNSKELVRQVEGYISSAMKASLFTDDDLRPAFEALVRITHNAADANRLLQVAMDVAAGKGIDLKTASEAVAKAQAGQFGAVNRLIPGIIDMSDKTLTADKAVAQLARTFGGSAAAATDTAAGKAQMMKRDLGELAESIGTVLLPIITKLIDFVTPLIDKFSSFSSGTQTAIVVVGLAVAAIGPLVGVVTALGTALGFVAANPVVLIIAGIAALAAGLFYAYKHSETFRNAVDTAFRTVRFSVETMWNFVRPILDFFIDKLGRIASIAGTVGGVIGKIGGGIGGVIGRIPGFANGGVVPGAIGQAQLAMVHGGERISPYRGGDNGGGGAMSITVNVGGSVVTQQQLVNAVHDGLLAKQRQSGSLGFEAI